MDKKVKDIFIKIFIILVTATVISYILFLTVIPKIFSSHKFLDAIDELIEKKTGIVIKSEKLDVKTFPSLLINISADEFIFTAQKNELLKVKNASLYYDLKKLKPQKINIDYIYLNKHNLKNVSNTNKHKNTSAFKFGRLPDIFVKNAQIRTEEGEKNSIFVNIKNLSAKNEYGKTKCNFEAKIVSDLLKNPVYIGQNGAVYFENNKLYADNLEILAGISILKINGKLIDNRKNKDFTIEGTYIPVSDTVALLLYFQKLNDKSKKFMENFYDYSGNLNINLNVTNKGIFGEINAIKLSGKSVLFNVPIIFEKVPVKFEGNEVYAGAEGFLGSEKVFADFFLTNMFSSKKEAKGTVHSVLTNNTIEKYIPNASIRGKVDTSVNWYIQDKKIDITYKINIPKDSDIYYSDAYLGLSDKDRLISVNTFKHEDKLEIKNYEYSINENNANTKIIQGDGLFIKRNGHFEIEFITCKTQNDTPVSIAASFYKYLEGGTFNGNLKYDFHKNKITGNFNIKNSTYKNYKISEAKINAYHDSIEIEAFGDYDKSPFQAFISGFNDFNDKIHIYKLYLFLEELTIHNHKKSKNKIHIDEKTIKSKTDNFDIDLYSVRLNKLKYKKAVLTNILLDGSIKDNILNFEVPNIDYANGKMNAKGFYDFNKRISDVVFSAKNIDSNIAADTLFNLQNQIHGTANAVLKVKTTNGIANKNSHIDFSIKQGYLPELGSTEFMFKLAKLKKKTYAIQDIINIDLKNMKALASDIDGSYDYCNGEIKNADITSVQKYLSLLIKGDYNTESHYADLDIFGKYNNKEISKIKIFFVPLSFMVKILFRPEKTIEQYKTTLKNVPDITIKDDDDLSAFRVKLKGNVNKHNFDIEMKKLY